MKTLRMPTNFIVDEIMWNDPTTIHLFGRYFWNPDRKVLLIGDKTLRQHRAKYYTVIK